MGTLTVGPDPVRVVIDVEPGSTITSPDYWQLGREVELTIPTTKKVYVVSMSEAEILKRVGKLSEDSDIKFLVDGYRRLQAELAAEKRDRAREFGELSQKFEDSKSFWRKKHLKVHGEVELEAVDAAVKAEFPPAPEPDDYDYCSCCDYDNDEDDD